MAKYNVTDDKKRLEKLGREVQEAIGTENGVQKGDIEKLNKEIDTVLSDIDDLETTEMLKKVVVEILEEENKKNAESEIVEEVVEEIAEEVVEEITEEVAEEITEEAEETIEEDTVQEDEIEEIVEEVVEEIAEETEETLEEVEAIRDEAIKELLETVENENLVEEQLKIVEVQDDIEDNKIDEEKDDKNMRYEDNKEEMYMDIPEVRKTLIEKIKNKFNKKESKIEKFKNWYEVKKNNIPASNKSLFKCVATGTLTSATVAGALVTASMALSIGLIPTLLITSCYVAAAGTLGYIFKEEVKNFKELKKNEELQKEENIDNNDIPEIKESKIKKLGKSIKQKFQNVKENVTSKVDSIKLNIQERKELRKQEKIRKAPEKLARKFKIQKLITKALHIAGIVMYGAIGVMAVSVVGVLSPMISTVGILPILLVNTVSMGVCLGALYKMYSNFGEYEKLYGKNKDKVSEEEIELVEELETENIKSNVKNLNVNSEVKVSKAQLVRDEKIGRVKTECKLEHVKNLNAYCISIPKQDISLQRFIRSEIKKEYPEENIQSFVSEDKKVLVLTKEPKLFR